MLHRSIRLLIAVASGLSIAAITAAYDFDPTLLTAQSPYWLHVLGGLGGIRLNGTANIEYPLFPTDDLQRYGLRFALRSDIDIDTYGNALSVWQLLGLNTFLSPRGRSSYEWLPIDASSKHFNMQHEDLRAHKSVRCDGGWELISVASERFDIRAPDNVIWHYDHGSLVGADYPNLPSLKFLSIGTNITLIRADGGPGQSRVFLQAYYDSFGRPTRLILGANGPHMFNWDCEGRLASWEEPNGAIFRFSYSGRLLTRISRGAVTVDTLSWTENSGFSDPNSNYILPVHLAADAQNQYSFEVNATGIRIERRPKCSDLIITTLFNPRRNVLKQWTHSTELTILLRTCNPEPVLSRIEDAEGKLLEDYEYNQHGEISRIESRSSGTRKWRYDLLGRLVSVAREHPE